MIYTNKLTRGEKHLFPIKIKDISYLFDPKLLSFLKEQKCEYLDDIVKIFKPSSAGPLQIAPDLIFRRAELMSSLVKTNYDMFLSYYLDDHVIPIPLTFFKHLPNSQSFNTLQAILPNSVFKALRSEGINNLSQLVGMTSAKLEDIHRHSQECFKAIGDIISIVTNSPKSISKDIAACYCDKYGIPNLPIRPIYALGYIPNILYNKLIVLDIKDVKGLLAINFSEFSRQRHIGDAVVQDMIELCKFLLVNTEFSTRVIGSFVPEGTIGMEIAQENLFDLVCKTVNQCYDRSKKLREKEILFRRNHLLGIKYYTLEEIAHTFDLTRERIRQIEFAEYNYLKEFLLGDREKESNIFINPELSILVRNFVKTLSIKRFWHENDVFQNLRLDSGKSCSDWVKLIMRILGYENITVTGETIYYENILSPIKMREAIEFILHILQMHPIGLSVKDMKFEMHKTRNLRLSELEIEYLAQGLSDVESFVISDRALYRIRLAAINRTELLAFRILYEHGEPLHFNEITSLVNSRIMEGSSRERIRNVATIKSSMMRNQELFAPIGKSGMWALVSWNLEIRPIFEILQEILLESGSPMSVDALYQMVLPKRNRISRNTINSILSIYDDLFCRHEDGSYELILK